MASITPADAPVGFVSEPPATQTKLVRHGRPLKRWRYVGVFCEELFACAALVQIGPARQSFWALQLRESDGAGASGKLRERTRLRPRAGEVELAHGRPAGAPAGREDGGEGVGEHTLGRLGIHDLGIDLDLELEEEAGVVALCRHGRGWVWTRKQAGIAARGTLRLGDIHDGKPLHEIDARAVIDDTAGHHARRTEWHWSAGVGQALDGSALAWNLVSGVNDPPRGSERAVWVAGEPHETPPVCFAEDLSSIDCEDGSRLDFTAEAERTRRENLLIVRSDYRAPFGSFSGTLPGGVPLAHGLGVMEHHRARW